MKKIFLILLFIFINFSVVFWDDIDNYKKITEIQNVVPLNSYIDKDWNYISEYYKEDFDNIEKLYSKSHSYYWYVIFDENNDDNAKTNIKKELDSSYYKYEKTTINNKNIIKVIFNTNKLFDSVIKKYYKKWSFSFFFLNYNSSSIIDDKEIINLYLNNNYEKYKNLSKNYINNVNNNNVTFYNVILEKVDNGNLYIIGSRTSNNFKAKYNKYYTEDWYYILNLTKDNTIIKSFIRDLLIDILFSPNFVNNLNTWFYIDKNNWDYYVIWKTNKKILDFSINSHFEDWKIINCWNEVLNNQYFLNCNNNYDFENEIKLNPNEYLSNKDDYTYINISKLYKYFYKSNFNFKDIQELFIDLSNNNLSNEINFFSYRKSNNNVDDFLPITSQIKTLKNISTNPYLISVNFLLALLYLLIFYFTAQLFNSYFEELSTKNRWNEKISNILEKIIKFPFDKLYNFIIKKSNSKIVSYVNKIKSFLIKYKHKFYVIVWFLWLWIIGQVVVDDFDIFSLKWWLTIVIMIFILAFITLFKDILLYILNKWKEKDSLKLENIPIWFIFAWIIAGLWRYIWMIPWVIFWNVIKINSKSKITSRKTSKPSLLLKVLFVVFSFWLTSWFLAVLFPPTSFPYKFLIVTYFGLVNDVFFALLPFGMLWGIYILKDPKIKTKWFVFTFIVFFFLLHTIVNSDWDLDKLLNFNWNFKVLVWILFFWILVTWILYFINKKVSKSV